ncbi:HalOD1 output domain-containing protein [Halobellus sp. GM3]|uniref:HalOD1 output domain-containing protein n=1 Tax=Halobellus sp. GM3 TaxID=3458410 RepID=UPI00403DF15E
MNRHNLDRASDEPVTDSSAVTRMRGPDEEPSWSVIEAVAEATGTDLARLRPLYDVIDPDALDAICDSAGPERGSSNACVAFRFEGCAVSVYADGRTVVSRPSVE